jgi:uncharacterized membrane protein
MSFLHIIDSLVFISGFFIWVLVLPQILLILKKKQAQTNSLFLTVGSLVFQLLLLTQAVLWINWPSAFVMGTSVVGNAIVTVLILYFRRYPGGRKISAH